MIQPEWNKAYRVVILLTLYNSGARGSFSPSHKRTLIVVKVQEKKIHGK